MKIKTGFVSNSSSSSFIVYLKDYFLSIKNKNNKTSIIACVLVDSIDIINNTSKHIRNSIFPYSDTIIVDISEQKNEFFEQKPSNKSLFHYFNIYSTPTILIVSDQYYLYYAQDIFSNNGKINKSLTKNIKRIKF